MGFFEDGLEAASLAMKAEVLKTSSEYGPFNSPHEGYAVLKEELEELWGDVKANNLHRAIEEAIQVGAMAMRFVIDFAPLSKIGGV